MRKWWETQSWFLKHLLNHSSCGTKAWYPEFLTVLRRGSQVILRINCSVQSYFSSLNHLCLSLLFFLYSVLTLFICSHPLLERGLKSIVPLGRQLSLSFVSLSLWFQHKQKTVSVDGNGSDKQQGTYQIKASSRGLIKPKTHLVNQVVSDVEHPLKTHSWGERGSTHVRGLPPHYHPILHG